MAKMFHKYAMPRIWNHHRSKDEFLNKFSNLFTITIFGLEIQDHRYIEIVFKSFKWNPES